MTLGNPDCLHLYDGTAVASRMTIDTTGNVGIGTTGPDYKLEVAGAIMMEDSSAPTAMAGHSGVYSSGGELFAFDAAGNSTQISPHDSETGEWVFYSKNVKTGRVLKINMEELIFDLAAEMSEKTGKQYIEEYIEK